MSLYCKGLLMDRSDLPRWLLGLHYMYFVEVFEGAENSTRYLAINGTLDPSS